MSGSDFFAGVFTYVGWAFLPSLATSGLQSLFYQLTVRAGSRRPQPGQPLHAAHRRRIHILVLILYLIYTFFQTLHDIRLAGDFYADLGVSPSSSDREIRSKFRRLAARFHPDKLRRGGGGSNGDDEGQAGSAIIPPASPASSAESVFVHLKLAHDTLLDPAKRFAYDRFGPSIVRLQQPGLTTIPDYVYAGLRSLAPEYARGGLALLVLNWFWLPRWGMFWRYMAILSLATLELYFLTHEWRSSKVESAAAAAAAAAATSWSTRLTNIILSSLIPTTTKQSQNLPLLTLLPFQILTLARRLSISLNIFISQLAPPKSNNNNIIINNNNNNNNNNNQSQHLQNLQTLQTLAHRTETEASRMLTLELSPFKQTNQDSAAAAADPEPGTDPETKMDPALRNGMVESIVRSCIRSHPDVSEAIERAVVKRRRTERRGSASGGGG